MYKRVLLTLLIVAGCALTTKSQNPIIGNIGVSDPHIRIFNDTIYLFSGHDSSPEDKTWVMRDWRVFATTDLVAWEHINTIYPKDNYMGEQSSDCWAGDAMMRNGKCYFYFSDRTRGVGVMGAASPRDTFKDLLGEPLVAPMHDPTILIEDDSLETPYIIYGCKRHEGYHIAQLRDDMKSLAESPKLITINGEEWENTPNWQDKNYIFKYKDTYYLSWGSGYAVSKNIYGPYQCEGNTGHGYSLGILAHSSFFWWKGQFYHAWCEYLRKGYRWRKTNISYCHITDDGKIVTDTKFLDLHYANGVARYNSSWDKIEAEWFYEVSEGVTKRGSAEAGFYLNISSDREYVAFQKVTISNAPSHITLNQKSRSRGAVEVRVGDSNGRVIGKAQFKPSKGEFEAVEIPIKIESESEENICIVYKSRAGVDVDLDYIRFE